MAHSFRWRDWRSFLMARLPSDCPLCLSRTKAGRLCQGCAKDVCESMDCPTVLRCPVCVLRLDSNGRCADCAMLRPCFNIVMAAFDYEFPGNVLIHQLKGARRYLLAAALAELLVTRLVWQASQSAGATILVPVPASRRALRERGFNPSAEVAAYLSRRLGLPCRTGVLVRRKEAGPHKKLGRLQRYQQVQDLYTVRKSVKGYCVWVVDDVLTTGSTLNAAARLLIAAGAESVQGVVLARTPFSS